MHPRSRNAIWAKRVRCCLTYSALCDAQGKAAREAARKAKSKDNTSLNGSGMWGWCWREEYGSSQRPDFGRIEGREAAVEFHKILDHCGIAMNEPIGARIISNWVVSTPCRANHEGGII